MVRQSFAALEDRAHHRLCSGQALKPPVCPLQLVSEPSSRVRVEPWPAVS